MRGGANAAIVMPAQAGIPAAGTMDSGLRRNDGCGGCQEM